MPSEVESLLATIGERADDLRMTLQSFDPRRLHDWGATLSHFQHLTKQVELLHAKSSDGMLAYLLALPVEVSAEQSTAIPAVLSTRLDKEHEDKLAILAILETQGQAAVGTSMSEVERAAHNKQLDTACLHLKEAAAALDLPRARDTTPAHLVAAQMGTGSRGNTPSGAPAPLESLPSELSAETAKALLAALRCGEGLRAIPDGSKRQRM